MRTEYPIQILEGQTREPVDAVLIEGVTHQELTDSDHKWQPFLAHALLEQVNHGVPASRLPQHLHWSWRRKASFASTSSFVGISCGGDMQGLMLVEIGTRICRLKEHENQPLAYVDYLATAPWNLPSLVRTPRYRAVGTLLMVAAVQLSQESGCEGRIGLHSLPQAEEFYTEKCGMIPIGIDADCENLLYCEMSVEGARRFLEVLLP